MAEIKYNNISCCKKGIGVVEVVILWLFASCCWALICLLVTGKLVRPESGAVAENEIFAQIGNMVFLVGGIRILGVCKSISIFNIKSKLFSFSNVVLILNLLFVVIVVDYLYYYSLDPRLFANLYEAGSRLDAFRLVRVIIVAPFVEELCFRGVLLNGLSLRYGRLAGLLLSSLLFGLFHGYCILIIPIFCFGCIAGCLYQIAGSVAPCIAFHFLFNLMCNVFYLWPSTVLPIGIVLLLVFLFGLYRRPWRQRVSGQALDPFTDER